MTMSMYMCWVTVLALLYVTANGNVNFPAIKPNGEWWSNSIIYQLYPRSFKDSDNDGVGDLKGIIEKLDYFVDLGIDILWIGPLFKSPQDDMGYDVEDYKMIDPLFGSMDDFDELILEMNKRNLKLMTDIVPNHSSYKCDWFQKSINREGKYENYYVWRNASNNDELLKNASVIPIPPNNWLSIFGGSGWAWNDNRKQFYFHQFSEGQPDFDLRNPDVKQEFFDILQFWMDRGVVGFRFDALKHLYEDILFRDEPFAKGVETITSYDSLEHIYILDQPEVIDIIIEWRKYLDNYTKNDKNLIQKIMATESYSNRKVLIKYYGNSSHPGAQIPFFFDMVGNLNQNNMISQIEKCIEQGFKGIPENAMPNWVIENHDNERIATIFDFEIVQMLTVLKLALPGIDVTYYGSEIGMSNSFVRIDQRRDLKELGASTGLNRDGERCPMQWDDSLNAGFTKARKPWLPVNPNYYWLNVEAQKKTPNSNYDIFKKMSQLRHTNTLKYGSFQSINASQSIQIIKRSLIEHESYYVVMNFGSELETIVLSNILNDYIDDKLYVYIGSKNSAYIAGNTVSSNCSNPVKLRPKSVVVLTNKQITTEFPTKVENGSSKIDLKFITLFCSFLISVFFFMS